MPPDPTGTELGIATTLAALLNGTLLASSMTMRRKVLAIALENISQNEVSEPFKNAVVRLQANDPLAKRIQAALQGKVTPSEGVAQDVPFTRNYFSQ